MIMFWTYWDKKCIKKERSWSYFVYFKEINWFEIKDNIKIEDYKLKFLEWWEMGRYYFSLSFLTIMIGKTLSSLHSIISELAHNMSRWKI